jgi:hypothetical protein
MPRVGFEPTTPVFERAKTVHVLEIAAIAIGSCLVWKRLTAFTHCFTIKTTYYVLIYLRFISRSVSSSDCVGANDRINND